MDILLLEPQFRSFAGHHNRYARVLNREARRRGYRLGVATAADLAEGVAPELRAEGIEVLPVFPDTPYLLPGTGWARRRVTRALLDTLRGLARRHPEARFAWLSGLPAMLPAAARIARDRGRGTPFLVLDFQRDWESPEGAVGTAPRHLRRALAAGMEAGLRPFAQTEVLADVLSREFGLPFRPFPPVLEEKKELRPAAPRRRPTFGLLNCCLPYKRPVATLERIAAARADLHWVVHTGPFYRKTARAVLERAAALGFECHDGALRPAEYNAIWSRLDGVLLPYEPDKYRRQGSGMFYEALADGKLALVPDGTSMARMVRDGAPALVYDAADPNGIGAALERVGRDTRTLLERARAFAPVFRAAHDARSVFDRLAAAWEG